MVDSRSLAQRLVMAGQVRVNGQIQVKPASMVESDAHIIIDQGAPFVSRGGEKLAAALAEFSISVTDRICADVGASTGGFTDCLLQQGALKVFAIDVGEGILHWKLRQDRRVIVMEGTNARFVEHLSEPVNLVTIDASFISLKILLPVVRRWFDGQNTQEMETSEVIALIKPQFEAGKAETARGSGVIRDPAIHQRILDEIAQFAGSNGFRVKGCMRSPLLGPKGNVEFLIWLGLLI